MWEPEELSLQVMPPGSQRASRSNWTGPLRPMLLLTTVTLAGSTCLWGPLPGAPEEAGARSAFRKAQPKAGRGRLACSPRVAQHPPQT